MISRSTGQPVLFVYKKSERRARSNAENKAERLDSNRG